MRTNLCVILSIPLMILSRNAVEFFITHKKVKTGCVEVLENTSESSKYWIQYKYIFETEHEKKRNGSLRVGVFNIGTKFDLIDCYVSNSGNGTVLKGYNMDIIKNMQESLGIGVEFTIVTDLSPLLTEEIDLLLCHEHPEKLPHNVTELHPTIQTNLVLLYKPSKLTFDKDIFILTFAGSLWLVFLIVMILLGLCLRISTKRYSRIKPDYEPLSWVEITLWAIAAACQQGLSHTPSGFASCFIFFLGYLMSYLLYTAFAATITSILVENVGILEDLKNVKLEKLRLVSTQNTRPHISQLKELFFLTEYVDSLDELFQKLNQNDQIGVGPEISVRQYLARYDQIASFQTMKLDVTFSKGFLALRDNPWRKTINEHIAAMYESGVLQNNLKRYLRPVATLDLKSGYSSAGREHVGSAILLFLGGISFALVFLVAEFVYYLYKRGRSKN